MFCLWDDLLNLIFPPRTACPFCGGMSPGGTVCRRCLEFLEAYRRESCCRRCGRLPGRGGHAFLSAGNDAAGLCAECRKRDWPFVLARAAGPYEGILKDAVHRLKYAGKRSLAGPLAEIMEPVLRAEPRFAAVDLLVPVPLSREKLLRRGFNQAALLARKLGVRQQIEVEENFLVKDFETLPQAGLSKSAREQNLKGVFKVKPGKTISGRNVLLIDDVFTTGSTMSAVSATLAAAGANQVFGLTAVTGRLF
ncbi:MAG: putative amidophosphoribosyltransferase [Pelotomaculum thermopropionicum]|uniref:Putative amidophosphoribosyltransferase n=1 Tax=Pelotomaculum thermopropionicum TaxID=110500 RepID=A0A101HTT0_9FIRM|nr:MAG: putative amidophosphoribosyltransferase [Pelotomaculum thermopropionicum]